MIYFQLDVREIEKSSFFGFVSWDSTLLSHFIPWISLLRLNRKCKKLKAPIGTNIRYNFLGFFNGIRRFQVNITTETEVFRTDQYSTLFRTIYPWVWATSIYIKVLACTEHLTHWVQLLGYMLQGNQPKIVPSNGVTNGKSSSTAFKLRALWQMQSFLQIIIVH